MKPLWLAVSALLAGFVLASGVAAKDPPRQRQLTLARGAASNAARSHLSPADVPSGSARLDFPGMLRSGAVPPGPDGLLWRRLRRDHPEIDPQRLLRSPIGPTVPTAALEPVTFKILALRVDFLEDEAGSRSTTTDGRFDMRSPDSARIAIDPPPHGRDYFDAHLRALTSYYEKQSSGRLRLEWDIFPTEPDSAYHLANTADYGPWNLTGSDEEILALAEKFVRNSFAAADTSAAPPDFRDYDGFIIFHAGPDLQGDINRDSPYDIPSFNIQFADPVAVQDSTFFIDLVMVMPEYVTQDGYLGALNGVMTHEFGHQLGFYDLYNVLNFFPAVGMFSLMDSGDNLYGTVYDPYAQVETFVRGAIPSSIDPWHKLTHPFFRDGMNAVFVDEDFETALQAVQTSHDLAVVPIGGQRVYDGAGNEYLEYSEYFILENREYDLNHDGAVYLDADSATGVILGPMNIPLDVTDSLGIPPDELGEYEQDYLLPGSGILVWHIDNLALADAFNVCYGCVNVLPGRRAVDVEEADGIEDLGDIYSVEWTGGMYDYWFQGGFTRFGPDTDPNTNSSGGGITDKTIEVRDSVGVAMRVAISGGRLRPGWPVYTGVSARGETMNCADLDGNGQNEIVSGAGQYVLALDPDGSGYGPIGGAGLIAVTDSLLLPGVAVRTDFAAPHAAGTVIATASGTRVQAWDANGEPILVYPPEPEVIPTLRFTAGPMMLDTVIVVGDSEGRLRGLQPRGIPEMRWRTATPGFAVTALAAGDVFGTGGKSLVWGNAAGEVYLATGDERDGFKVADGWPRSSGGSPAAIDWLLLVGGSSDRQGLVISLDDSGRLALFAADGADEGSWVRDLEDTPAGPPAVGDPDGDGALEIVATCVDGRIHIVNLQGDPERFWPRSIWHPDVTPSGELRSGPVLFDTDGDGAAEIVQGSADGTIHVLSYSGDEATGWPAVGGFTSMSSPILAAFPSASGRGGDTATFQIMTADEAGFVTLLATSWPEREMRPGEMWRADGESGRTRFYPAALVPQPQAVAELIDEGSVEFTPNPVVGGQGWLRVRMGRPGTLEVRLRDTSGQQVWQRTFRPTVGTDGDRLPLDLESLAPGLYVAQISAEASGQREQLLRKLAIIR